MSAIITVSAGMVPEEGVPLALQVSKGALVGMVSNIICAVAASLLIPRTGWKKGLVGALAVWLVSVTAVYIFMSVTGLLG